MKHSLTYTLSYDITTPEGLTYIKSGNNGYQVMTDHLGSIVKMYDASGNQKFTASYDAWGRQSVTSSVTGLRRSYCGHEHWNEFGLIDMNGRMYDPVIGRFLSPDILVNNPANSQSFNRYSYCLNNPLKYSDPSGYAEKEDNRIDNVDHDEGVVMPNGGGSNGGYRTPGLDAWAYQMWFDRMMRYGTDADFIGTDLEEWRYDCSDQISSSLGFTLDGGATGADVRTLRPGMSVGQVASFLRTNYPLPNATQQPTSSDVVCYGSSDRYYMKVARGLIQGVCDAWNYVSNHVSFDCGIDFSVGGQVGADLTITLPNKKKVTKSYYVNVVSFSLVSCQKSTGLQYIGKGPYTKVTSGFGLAYANFTYSSLLSGSGQRLPNSGGWSVSGFANMPYGIIEGTFDKETISINIGAAAYCILGIKVNLGVNYKF